MLKIGFVAAALTLAACGSSGPDFTATLNSANETPASPHPNASATGTATYTISGTTVNYTLTFSGLSGNASAGHIHVGSATEAGGVVVPFTLPAATSGTVTGSFAAADVKAGSTPSATITAGDLNSLLTAMRAGNTYTNIHTASNPAGEIRGQNTPK